MSGLEYPSTPEEALRMSIAEKFGLLVVGGRGEVREFTAIALTDAVPLSRVKQVKYGSNSLGTAADAGRIGRYIIKAMIIGNANDELLVPVDNPHRYLLDPCQLGSAIDVGTTVQIIKMYTTYITSKDFNISSESLVRRGDKVRVTMTVDKQGAIRMEQGQLIQIISKAAQDPFLQTVCDSLQGKFDITKMNLLGTYADDGTAPPHGAAYKGLHFKFTYKQYCQLRQAPGFDKIMSFIASHEGSYSSVNRGCAGDSSGASKKWVTGGTDITRMRLSDVRKHQKGGSKVSSVRGTGKTGGKKCNTNPKGTDGFLAVGKYQWVPGTLKSNISAASGIGSPYFNEETQECMAMYLLLTKQRSLGAYLLGYYDDVVEAAQDLAREWSSQPLQYDEKGCDRGQSRYCGGGGNAVGGGLTPQMPIAYLQEARALVSTDATVASILSAAGYPSP